MGRVRAVISDFGGVLTSPLLDSFMTFQRASGIPLEALGQAMMELTAREGENPLYRLERGELTEAGFLSGLAAELSRRLGREVELESFGERYFEGLHANQRMIEYLRSLRERGYRLAICTNNVREWEGLWRAKLPVDEIFGVVVDSAFVGSRKPERQIYEITLERLAVAPEEALLIDDLEVNCQAAAEMGIRTVWYRSDEQAIEEVETALRGDGAV